jgi:hypothetical protein
MAAKIPLGDNLYLFTDSEGPPSPNLIISSHGGYFSRLELGRATDWKRNIPGLGGWIRVPTWTKLFFYSPHRSTLRDPGIAAMGEFIFDSYEILAPRSKVRNYTLEKFQTEEGESYRDIESAVAYNRKAFQTIPRAATI